MHTRILGIGAGGLAALGVALFSMADSDSPVSFAAEVAGFYIVQADSLETAHSAIERVAGEAIGELPLINAASASLTEAQVAALRASGGLRVYEDARLEVSGQVPDTFYPIWVGADRLHASGIDGSGIGIAIIDTGMWPLLASEMTVVNGVDTTGSRTNVASAPFSPAAVRDDSGHGTHIASVAAGSELTADGRYEGVAPGADVYVVKAFDASGYGTYLDVIEGIQWVVDHHEALGIRVMNLSFSGEPQSFYWDDPLNQAVMSAWEAGIVVVTSAGNTGPTPMTVGVPGNVPYVITVGSVDDNFTPDDNSDDFLSSFSSTGPTYEGFVKPELTAPGGHMLAHMNPDGLIPRTYPSYMDNSGMYFTMSGTSQAAGVISGVAALVLQANPDLTPDDVKCRLLRSAKPVVDADGTALYSIFQQGAGLVYAPDAVYGDATGCANVGLDIAADLSGDAHYVGAATQLEDGTFALVNPETQQVSDVSGTTWDGSYTYTQGYTWSGGDGGTGIPGDEGGTTSNDGYTWSGGDGGTGIPGDGGGATSNDGYMWGSADGGGGVEASVVSGGAREDAYTHDATGRPRPHLSKLVRWAEMTRSNHRAERGLRQRRSARGYTWRELAPRDVPDGLPNVMERRNMGVSEWVIPDVRRRRATDD